MIDYKSDFQAACQSLTLEQAIESAYLVAIYIS